MKNKYYLNRTSKEDPVRTSQLRECRLETYIRLIRLYGFDLVFSHVDLIARILDKRLGYSLKKDK